MVGETEICTQCKQSFVPINGACVEAAANNDKCKDTNGSTDADQTCKMCLLQTFMYKGGCYLAGSGTGGKLCAQAENGICTQAVATKEYFVPSSDTDAIHDSVVS